LPAKIYYIRPNHTTQLPANVLVLDTETEGTYVDDVTVHRMTLGWTWRMHLDDKQEIVRDDWREWGDAESLGDYITGEARAKAPLWVVGSNITFDIFASGLGLYLNNHEWTASIVYDKGLTTILRLDKGTKRLCFLAVQNFLVGGVGSWGAMLGLPKLDVEFGTATQAELSTYCKRDTEITGRAFLEYLRFVEAHDMGGFQHTRASQSFSCWRHRFMHTKVLHYDQISVNQFTRRSYYGGRVESGFIGTIRGEPMVKLDINSMYPAVMRDRLYPTKLVQWVNEPTDAKVEAALADSLVTAEVELDTNEPIYPYRDRGKLLFPLGQFAAHLPTATFRHAWEAGHVTKVRQLMLFDGADLFSGFVDEWYALRQKYQAEGNAIYAQICKLILNSLYGKFGELREKEIHRGDDDDREFYRRECTVPTELVYEEPPTFDWRYDAADWPTSDYVNGTEWSAWGTSCVTAGLEEGPHSMPPIAAHVTDYGRMLLWDFMSRVGLDNVLYCDTDSLIIRERHLDTLEAVIDANKLGSLKIEESADYLNVHGPKDYTFGDDTKIKGVRASALEYTPGNWIQSAFPGLYSLMRRGELDGFPIGTMSRARRSVYDKGFVQADGTVRPWTYSNDAQLRT